MPGAPETVELVLVVEVGADPVRGSLRGPDGRRREFWGWLELADIIEGASWREPAGGRPGAHCRSTTEEQWR